MKNKLTKSDWLEFGLKSLVKSGAASLKADPMAKALNVSRGSFYWHFEDIEAFRNGVLALWRDKATTLVIEAINEEPRPADRLVGLLDLAFNSDLDMDRAIRAWAIHDNHVATIVSEVDSQRMQYLGSLFADIGFGPNDARTRATFLYWAFLGRITTPDRSAHGPDAVDVAQIVHLLLRRPGKGLRPSGGGQDEPAGQGH